MITATPATLAAGLKSAKPGDTIQLATGNYPGSFILSIPGVTLEPASNATPIFTGPTKYVLGSKPAWLRITAGAKGATVRGLEFERPGDIIDLFNTGWNDYGIVVEAPDVTITGCTMFGMAKGIHVKGDKSTGGTITHNQIGPTIDSNIALGTSLGVIRGLLIGWNTLRGSLREDAVQFMQDFDLSIADQETDISNLGVILYENAAESCNENAYDMKGAGLVIIHGGTIRKVAGYSNGYPFDPSKHYGPVIMHGARTISGLVIVRNVDIENCGGGIKVFPLWHIFHNRLYGNNYDPSGRPWEGTGILQPGATPTAAVVNNLSVGHLAGNYSIAQMWPDFRSNYSMPQAGEPVTTVKGAGSGSLLPVEDARYFTDWFGRKDLPADVLYLGSERYEVQDVDYVAQTVRLDREATWHHGDPVYWRSPSPVVGIQPEYIAPEPPTSPVEPPLPPTDPTIPPGPENPPTDPPTQPVTVSLNLTFDLAPALAQSLREAVASGTVHIDLVEKP